jgi:hypothetical protein
MGGAVTTNDVFDARGNVNRTETRTYNVGEEENDDSSSDSVTKNEAFDARKGQCQSYRDTHL